MIPRLTSIAIIAGSVTGLLSCANSVTAPLETNTLTQHLLFQARYAGTNGTFLLDTGTSMPVLSTRFVGRHQPGAPVRVYDSQASVAPVRYRGDRPNGDLLTIEGAALSIGNARFDAGTPYLLLDLSGLEAALGQQIDGIIGGGILNSATYRLDVANQQITLSHGLQGHVASKAVTFDNQLPIVTVKVNVTCLISSDHCYLEHGRL